MKDKDWLVKVSLAATVYNTDVATTDSQRQEIDKFVTWLYKQYGVELPSDAKK